MLDRGRSEAVSSDVSSVSWNRRSIRCQKLPRTMQPRKTSPRKVVVWTWSGCRGVQVVRCRVQRALCKRTRWTPGCCEQARPDAGSTRSDVARLLVACLGASSRQAIKGHHHRGDLLQQLGGLGREPGQRCRRVLRLDGRRVSQQAVDSCRVMLGKYGRKDCGV